MCRMKQPSRVLIPTIAGALLITVIGWAWWTNAHQDLNKVFWDMLSNNLSTKGVTHISEQSGKQLDVAQYTQVTFGQKPKVHALTVFKQGKSTLATEQVSDATHNFVRYKQIDIPAKANEKRLDTKNILGKWAAFHSGDTVTGQVSNDLFKQSLLDILPMGDLAPKQRAEVIGAMHTQSLFTYNTNTVTKANVRGREVYLYAVKVKPDAYVRIMQQFESMVGAETYKHVKSTDLAKSQPLSVVMAIDARSHTLSQIYDVSTKRTERYEGFGIADTSPLPTANISTVELTQRLGELLQK